MIRTKKTVTAGIAILTATLLCGAGTLPYQKGDLVFTEDFSRNSYSPLKSAEIKNNVLTITAGTADSGKASEALTRNVLGQDSKADARRNYTVTRGMMGAFAKAQGYLVEVSAEIKADVPREKKPWEGIRFAVNYRTETSSFNDCRYNLYGTFDWKPVSFTTRIPAACKDASLTLGIIGKKGSVSFRNVKIKVIDLPRSAYFTQNARKPYKGHSLERLRGFNSQSWVVKDNHLSKLKQKWNCNILTGTMDLPPAPLRGKELDAWLEKNVYPVWDLANAKAAASGLYFMFQMSSGKWRDGKSFEQSDYFYYKPEYADSLVEIWSKIAKRYKGQRYIYGFQLLNESCRRIEKQPGCPDYEEMMERIAQAINRIDPERTIVVQPEQYWGMRAFDTLRPLNAKNVVYAPHFYAPFPYSHQGIGGNGTAVTYPGKIKGIDWNKETLRKDLQSARDFQKAYNAHMIVTEFSAVAGAPNREKWVQDAISLFEEYDWDWTFHAEVEWYGWRPDYEKSEQWTAKDWAKERSWKSAPNGTPTSNMMKTYFRKNQFLPVIPYNSAAAMPEFKQYSPGIAWNLNYPAKAVCRTGYVCGKGLTFEPGSGISRASWLKKDSPTTFLSVYAPFKSDNWEPFEFSFKVRGNGKAVLVFQSNGYRNPETKQSIPTWTCYKDIEILLDGKQFTAPGFKTFQKNGQPEKWGAMGAFVKDNGNYAVLASEKHHLHTTVPVKDGDTITVRGFARRALPADIAGK